MFREAMSVPAAECRSMADVRREIDRIDRILVQLLAERLTYIERAGHIRIAARSVTRLASTMC
jgi:isochorismate pyruvate lyase